MAKKAKFFKWSELKAGLKEVQAQLMLGMIDPKDFDMSVGARESCNVDGGGCGTKACIGGHLALILGLSTAEAASFVSQADQREDGWNDPSLFSKQTAKRLSPLFYPDVDDLEWQFLTPAQASVAIDRFLAGSVKPWKGLV